MAYLTVIIDDITPATQTSIIVNYRWFAIDTTTEVDSASEEFPILTNSAQMNTAVINSAVTRAGTRGITIQASDRKLLVGGIQ